MPVTYSPRKYTSSYEDPTNSSTPLYDYVGPTGPTGPTGPMGPDLNDFDGGIAGTVYASTDIILESAGA